MVRLLPEPDTLPEPGADSCACAAGAAACARAATAAAAPAGSSSCMLFWLAIAAATAEALFARTPEWLGSDSGTAGPVALLTAPTVFLPALVTLATAAAEAALLAPADPPAERNSESGATSGVWAW